MSGSASGRQPKTSFNGCAYLLDRQIAQGNGARVAITGIAGELTYRQLLIRVRRAATTLRHLGLQPEQRIVLIMSDSPEFVVTFLAALRVGAIAVPVSTMVNSSELIELLRDSRARLIATTPEYVPLVESAVGDAADLIGIVTANHAVVRTRLPVQQLDGETAWPSPDDDIYPTSEDSPAFWLYTSGTTGMPKAAMHRHGTIKVVCETYPRAILEIGPEDRCLSTAKAFFAYGLSNSVFYPLSVGACSILEPAPSRPEVIAERVRTYRPTLFFSGPTFFANMLRENSPRGALCGVRIAVSAGEGLPVALHERCTKHFGIEILDGLGMTEMTNIFISQRVGAVRPGATGVPVAGYELRIVDDAGHPVPDGVSGSLLVRGDSAATGYWLSYDASRTVFQGHWVRTGDTFVRSADGFYTCLGRTGDMLKISGIWVSPAEVEARLVSHEAVAHSIVVGVPDRDELDKLVAYVQLLPDRQTTENDLIAFCHDTLPSFKCPRAIQFVTSYPTTSSGKVRRIALREEASSDLALP